MFICAWYRQAGIVYLHETYGITALITGDILNVCNSFMDKAVIGTGQLVLRFYSYLKKYLCHYLRSLMRPRCTTLPRQVSR